MAMDLVAERADVRTGAVGSRQQLNGGQRRLLGIVTGLDTMPATLLADVLAQKLMPFWIENADV